MLCGKWRGGLPADWLWRKVLLFDVSIAPRIQLVPAFRARNPYIHVYLHRVISFRVDSCDELGREERRKEERERERERGGRGRIEEQ